LFDDALGKFYTEPVKLFLKKGAEVPHPRPYPIPKIYEELIISEAERLCDLWVLERIEEDMGFNGARSEYELLHNRVGS